MGVAPLEGVAVIKRALAGILALMFAAPLSAAPTAEICVIVGAHGEEGFSAGFTAAARAWEQAAARGGASCTVLGLDEEANGAERDLLQNWLTDRAGESPIPVWIVYLGHGTFDGREARLNLRGPDLTAKELATWLQPVRRPIVFIHGGSAGAPFIAALSAPDRIIVSATRSGNELNYARFGERFAEAVANPAADIDQDGQTSVLEAFVTAAQRVQAFYKETGRLATEHALIDDNGDKQGTPAEWFRGVRLQRRPKGNAEADGSRAALIALVPSTAERALTPAQRTERDGLERELEALRARKSELEEDDYYRQLEAIARKLGALYRADS